MDLKAAWQALLGKKEPAASESGPKGERLFMYQGPWTRHYQRKRLWDDIDLLDKDEVIVARALDFIARFATQFVDPYDPLPATGFRVEAPDGEMAMFGSLIPILQQQAFETVRYTVKFADLFAEIVQDPTEGDIANVKMFPYSYQIERNVNKFGAMLAGDPAEALRTKTSGMAAYDQRDDQGNLLAAFWPYQIAHWGFGNKQGLQYHEPMLGPVVSPSKRLRAVEDGISIARLDRAYQTRVHHVPVADGLSEDETRKTLEAYRAELTQDVTAPYDVSTGEFRMSSRESPYQADTDIYLARKYLIDGKVIDADVTAIPADSANLENLEDVFLLVRRVLCGTGVPADFLNLAVGQRSFIDKTTPEKREAFLYLCSSVQTAYVTTLRAILQLQLLLSGHRNPLGAEFRIIVPRISPREAEISANIDMKRANTAAIWYSIGIPKDVTGKKVLQMTPAEIDKWVQSEGFETPGDVNAEDFVAQWRDVAQKQLAGDELMIVPVGGRGGPVEATAQ